MAHPVHDVVLPNDLAVYLPTVIEIPRGSNCKFQVDEATGLLRLDRVLHGAFHYPANYGFVPRTHAPDGDPLDVLVLMQEPVAPLTIVRARAIGGFRMVDEKGIDDKIIAVAIDDPAFAHYRAVEQLPTHVMLEMKRFFQDYKEAEDKIAAIGESFDRESAMDVVRDAASAYLERQRLGVDASRAFQGDMGSSR